LICIFKIDLLGIEKYVPYLYEAIVMIILKDLYYGRPFQVGKHPTSQRSPRQTPFKAIF
jgi:hypothetical protein